MFKKYFALKLAELGYPTDDVHFALDYRFGDGVAFFGVIPDKNIPRIACRLLCELGRRDFSSCRAVIRKAVKLGVGFEIVRLDLGQCLHLNGMYVKCILPQGLELSPYQQNVVESFAALLREDVVATAGVLTSLGYSLIGATPPEESVKRVMVRGSFAVLVKELPDPHFDPFLSFGNELGKKIADAMTTGLVHHYGLRVEVRSVTGGPALGQASTSGIVEDLRYGPSGHMSFAAVRGLMRDAARQARQKLAPGDRRAA